jgi:hypothetical protein
MRAGGRKKQSGYFDTPEEAHQRYLQWKRLYHRFGTL